MIEWRKSSRSGGMSDNACVEVADLGRSVGVRDSKDRDAEHLGFSPQEFAGLMARIKRGELAFPTNT